MFKICCFLLLVGCAFAEPPPGNYLPPRLSLFVQLDSLETKNQPPPETQTIDQNFVVDQGYLPPGNGGPPSGSYGPPSGSYGPPSDTYGPPNGGNGNKPPPVYGPPEDATEPAKYSFEWEVNDPESGNEYGQKEERDGDNTVGSYNVLLPDGRKQIVEYTVDKDGYHPVIKYEGEAKPNGNGGGYPSGPNGGYRY